MAAVTVTMTVGATVHYWLQAQASVSASGGGVVVPDPVHGYQDRTPAGASTVLSLTLDNSFLWDVFLSFKGAAPVIFEGFSPGSGGDLLTLLSAQGWTAL